MHQQWRRYGENKNLSGIYKREQKVQWPLFYCCTEEGLWLGLRRQMCSPQFRNNWIFEENKNKFWVSFARNFVVSSQFYTTKINLPKIITNIFFTTLVCELLLPGQTMKAFVIWGENQRGFHAKLLPTLFPPPRFHMFTLRNIFFLPLTISKFFYGVLIILIIQYYSVTCRPSDHTDRTEIRTRAGPRPPHLIRWI